MKIKDVIVKTVTAVATIGLIRRPRKIPPRIARETERERHNLPL